MLLRYETADELESPDTPYVKSCLRVTKTVPYVSNKSIPDTVFDKSDYVNVILLNFSSDLQRLYRLRLCYSRDRAYLRTNSGPRGTGCGRWTEGQHSLYTSDPCPQAIHTPIPTHSFLKRIHVLGCSHGSSCNHSVPLFQVRQYVYSVNGVNVLREDHHKVAQRIMGSDKDYINICVMSHKRDIKDK